ncbi:MAG: PadR family transcriptional regulator [Kineosporiaceae bacterium]
MLAAVSEAPNHGYAIAQALADKGFGVIKGGTLYPLLARLEADGLVASTWQAGDGGPGRKVFAITGDGRLKLARQVQLWQAFTTTVSAALMSEGSVMSRATVTFENSVPPPADMIRGQS